MDVEPVEVPAAGQGRMTIVVGLMFAMALAAMDNTIVATAIPSIVRELGGFALFPWVFSIYMLIQAATIPIYGKLADLYGRKPILLLGIVVFLAGSVLSGLAWNMTALIVFRGLQGIGAGAVQPVTTTVIGDLFDLAERARIQGYISSVWGLASVVGPAVGGLIVEYTTWRWIFYINVPIGLAALAMITTTFRERVHRRRQPRIDYAGSLLLTVGIGTLVFGLLQGGVAWAWKSAPSVGIFVVTVVALWLFYQQERRAPEPVLPLWVMGRRMLAGANLGSLMIGVITVGFSSFLPTFVQGDMGASPLVAGFTLAAMSVGWPLASTFSGRLYLRIGFRHTAMIGAGLAIVSGVGMLTLTPISPVWVVGAMAFAMGVGLGFGSTSLLVGVQSVVDWGQRGVVTGANMFTRQLGGTVGVAIYGGLLNTVLARWFANPPAAVAAHLPRSLNATTLLLSPGLAGVDPRAVAFVRQGLFIGIRHIFWGILVAAALTLVVETVMPREGPTAGGGG